MNIPNSSRAYHAAYLAKSELCLFFFYSKMLAHELPQPSCKDAFYGKRWCGQGKRAEQADRCGIMAAARAIFACKCES